MHHYESYTLPSGLRMIHFYVDSPVAYCGFSINAGTRDEQLGQFGIAHFTEHLLFKGTRKRRYGHIINRMENVGGELNAYTTKEETFIYSVFLEEHFERAFELLSDLTFNSQFPDNEIEKERDVILDEINSYKDNPAELIFDEFENLLFSGNEMGHNILGEPEMLESLDKNDFVQFHQSYYQPQNMVFFSTGKTPFKKIVRLADKYLTGIIPSNAVQVKRISPEKRPAQRITEDKDLYQKHVILGTWGYDSFNENKTTLFLLNNMLGGPGMNSRLNLSLREKSGLVYNVESNLTSYTDTGVFSIYFGCDPKQVEKCISLVNKELKSFREKILTSSQLNTAKKQLKGQLGVLCENRENLCLGMGKSFLHRNKYDSLQDIYQKIDHITAKQLLDTANEIFDDSRIFRLVY